MSQVPTPPGAVPVNPAGVAKPQRRIYTAERGLFVSPTGVRIWVRHDLSTFAKRLKALEAKLLQTPGQVLTEAPCSSRLYRTFPRRYPISPRLLNGLVRSSLNYYS